MRYTGIQPQYFPRLHYFARILNTDLFMIRDDAQYVRKHKYPGNRVDKSYQAHSPIKTSNGRFLLSIPISSGPFTPLYETKLADKTTWEADHSKALELAYGGTTNYSELSREIQSILNLGTYTSLAALNTTTIFWGIMHLLGHKITSADHLSLARVNQQLSRQHVFRLKEIRRATDSKHFMMHMPSDPNEKILMLLKETGATEDYCGGTATASYMDHDIFKDNGITVTVQDWECSAYPQKFPRLGFIPNLSILDLLMNVPLSEAQKILIG
jgi:hypothetical protein